MRPLPILTALLALALAGGTPGLAAGAPASTRRASEGRSGRPGRYGLPVYVTENGIADADDDLRPPTY